MKRLVLVALSLIVFCVNMFSQHLNVSYKNYMSQIAKHYNFSPADIAEAVVSSQHVSRTSGIQHVYLQQHFEGIPVYNAVLNLHIAPDGKLVHSSTGFFKDISSKVNITQPKISALQALEFVARNAGYSLTETPYYIKNDLLYNSGISKDDIPAKLIYQPVANDNLRLCWELVIDEIKSPDWWSFRIDAITGEVLDKNNWTISCDWSGHHNHNENCNSHHLENAPDFNTRSETSSNSYNIFSAGIESPVHGGRSQISDPANLLASPFAWHDTNGIAGAEFTTTRGNNVWAKEDRDNNNIDGYSPDGGNDLNFDFPLDFNTHPINSEDAIITNLFYWNNLMHDVWFHYGFDPASGNFQQNNYGLAGQGGDYVIADAQDGSGMNNANFSTPPDGNNPRMQMYFWTGITPTSFTVNAPASVAGNYESVVGNFGPAVFNLSGELAIVDDESLNPTTACTSLTNPEEINGKIAVIDRGVCQFGTKALHAQNAGAIAVVVCNNIVGDPFVMTAGTDGGSVTIPAVMMAKQDCDLLKVALPGVQVVMSGAGEIPYDSALDNGIIAHEYGHGISIRLAGGSAISSCLNNEEQMGEGWSDWFALMMNLQTGDAGTDAKGIGNYVNGEDPAGAGIRPYRYTTDLFVNPHTYNDIDGLSVPHGVGAVWCAMLWEMTWKLIDRYGLDTNLHSGNGGNNKAMHLVVEGLKLQPCSPGFVDGRDAILAADELLYNGENKCLIWEAFAKRGLGYGAAQGSSTDVTDGTESFLVPPSCSVDFVVSANVEAVNPGDEIVYTMTTLNNTENTIENISVVNEIFQHTTYVNGSATHNGTLSANTVSFPVTNLAPGQSLSYSFAVTVNANTDNNPYTTLESAESDNQDWVASASVPESSIWALDSSNPHNGTNAWFAANIATNNEQLLTTAMPFVPTANSQLKFWHAFNTEAGWDGGLVEFSTDYGNSWQDLGSYFSENGYNSTIDNNNATPAFSGNSNGYVQSVASLSAFAGTDIFIRFRFHSDAYVGADGWYLDDIELTNLEMIIPNAAVLIADNLAAFRSFVNPATRMLACEINCPTCDDGILNGNELLIDCGGTDCAPCVEGCMDATAHNFNPDAVLESNNCETCNDNVRNGDELAVDCGGALCEPCVTGCTEVEAHNFNPDAVVSNGNCETCNDNVRNGDETGVDCGGLLCEPCAVGCSDPAAHNYHPAPAIIETCENCNDGIQNGDELGVDCGGIRCLPCIVGCTDENAHNYNLFAQVDNGTCLTCDDGIRNGDETEVDCGGATCAPCGETCVEILEVINLLINVVDEYAANQKIHSPTQVTGSSDIIFKAGQEVELNAGFEVNLGSEFTVEIGFCNNDLNRTAVQQENSINEFEVPVSKAGMNALVAVEIYNLEGLLVKVWEYENILLPEMLQLSIGTRGLEKGIYQCVVIAGDEKFYRKFNAS